MEHFSPLFAFRWGEGLRQERYPLNVFVFIKVLGIILFSIHLTGDPWTLIIFSNIGLWKHLSFFKELVKKGQLTVSWPCLIYTQS